MPSGSKQLIKDDPAVTNKYIWEQTSEGKEKMHCIHSVCHFPKCESEFARCQQFSHTTFPEFFSIYLRRLARIQRGKKEGTQEKKGEN